MNAKFGSRLFAFLATPIFLSLAQICSADAILNQLSTTAGGFWLGTMYPSARSYTYVIAQTFQTDRSYSDVTAEVELYSTGFPGASNPAASFYIAADDDGVPGTPLASVQITVTSATPATYYLDFQSLSLLGDTNYWLVASSNSVEYGSSDTGSVPVWDSSSSHASLADQLALDANSRGWEAQDWAEGLSVAIFGNPTSASTGFPPPISLPPYTAVAEPSSLALLGIGLLPIGLILLRRRSRPFDHSARPQHRAFPHHRDKHIREELVHVGDLGQHVELLDGV
jgi:hypothetical protein